MKWYIKFGFTHSQYNGLAIMLILNIGLIVVSHFTGSLQQKKEYNFSELSQLDLKPKQSVFTSIKSFDPNSATLDELLNLKLQKNVAERLINYRSKIGLFKKKEDLLKIYGLDTSWYNQVSDSIKINIVNITTPKNKYSKSKIKMNLMEFDPNNVSEEFLLKMGIDERVVRNWLKFLEKGGKFKSCDDLKKVYGLTDDLFYQLNNHCKMDFRIEVEEEISVEINSSDSLSLLKIKGIGPVYSHRIISYRDLLGGFSSKEQLLEVYGIDSSVYNIIYKAIKIDNSLIKTIDINNATFKELLNHPYLSYDQVKSIVNYREVVGSIESAEELIQLDGFTSDDINKLLPYLKYQLK